MADTMRRKDGRRPDDVLVAAARAGAAAAFDELYRAHAPRLALRVRARSGRDEHFVADVVQETFARALEKLDRLRDPARFGAWLGAIADNVIVDGHRTTARCRPLDDETTDRVVAADAPPCAVAEAREAIRRLRRALAEIPARDAEAITLAGGLGLSPAELGRAIGVSPGAAKVRVHRARARLRAALDAGPARTGAVATVTALRPTRTAATAPTATGTALEAAV